MKHTLPELPYSQDALAPAMSAETFEYHYGKHLQTYIDNLNRMIEGSPYEDMSLEDIVKKATGGIFNNAAQTWNHTFFFQTLTPERREMPEKLVTALTEAFGSTEAFKSRHLPVRLRMDLAGRRCRRQIVHTAGIQCREPSHKRAQTVADR